MMVRFIIFRERGTCHRERGNCGYRDECRASYQMLRVLQLIHVKRPTLLVRNKKSAQ
jgi:hypothetical protein